MVILSILSILVGIIRSAISPPYLPICIIEKDGIKHLLKSSLLKNNVMRYCHANQTCAGETCPLHHAFCTPNSSANNIDCADLSRAQTINGIPGLLGSQFGDNFRAAHMKEGEIAPGVRGG